jgi:hypothetical protein
MEQARAMKHKTLSTAILLSCSAIAVYALLSITVRIRSTGTIKTVGVQSSVSSIDWDGLAPGAAATETVTFTNNGSVAEKLSMTTGNWEPSAAASYITLSWDREGAVLQPAASTSATFTLSVSASIIDVKQFSFDITVTGVEN